MTTENTPAARISALAAAQRDYFDRGETRSATFRRTMLRRLDQALQQWEQPLGEARGQDLHKSPEEAYLTELSSVRGEIRNHLRHLRQWMRPERRPTPLKLWPASSRILKQPLGPALIIAPWNYPVQLLLNPLVGAISAGCTAMLKPSPATPHVSQTLARMIAQIYDEEFVAVVEGHREVNTQLLAERWGVIFFTGSPAVGRVVMEAAARHLTPVVLELGGKSPVVVDRGADIRIAARRIAWGKALNAGQTCIAPDYRLVHEELLEEFIDAYRTAVRHLLGDDPRQSRHYVRIVNERAFDRVASYLGQGTVRVGGHSDRAERYIEPTLLTKVDPAAPVMCEEIFGPVLPTIPFREQSEIIDFITAREKPLALYYFGPEKQGREILNRTSSGGACLNDTIMHIANEALPFGGVGNSGMGSYHGRESFDAFSHRRAVVETPTWIDLPFRYMPYRMFRWVKHIL